MILTKQSIMAAFNIRKQTGMEKRSKRHVALTSGGCDLSKSGRMKDQEMQPLNDDTGISFPQFHRIPQLYPKLPVISHSRVYLLLMDGSRAATESSSDPQFTSCCRRCYRQCLGSEDNEWYRQNEANWIFTCCLHLELCALEKLLSFKELNFLIF